MKTIHPLAAIVVGALLGAAALAAWLISVFHGMFPGK